MFIIFKFRLKIKIRYILSFDLKILKINEYNFSIR